MYEHSARIVVKSLQASAKKTTKWEMLGEEAFRCVPRGGDKCGVMPLSQLIQEGFGFLEIRHGETFGEPVIDGIE